MTKMENEYNFEFISEFEGFSAVDFSDKIKTYTEGTSPCERLMSEAEKGYIILLPDLEGVDTVEEQLAIAARKAGIAELRGASVERFRVDRFKERGA